MAGDLLADIEKDTVNFADNFDGTLKEPEVLPALLPNLLLNGSTGIAVGMATNIPPHNLRELAAAISYLIDHYDNSDDIGVDELMQFVKGPDFPTGGIIVGTSGIHAAYGEGRGRIVVRGVAHVEEMNSHRQPHRHHRAALPGEQVHPDRAHCRAGARRPPGRHLRPARRIRPARHVASSSSSSATPSPRRCSTSSTSTRRCRAPSASHLLALVDGEPKLLRLKPALQIFIEHRRVVITRRTEFELRKARARAHILEGLLIALANLDDVIRTIRESPDADDRQDQSDGALQAVRAAGAGHPRHAAAPPGRPRTAEDRRRARSDVLATIADLEDLLANPKKILALIQTELNAMAEKYGDDRRTQIAVEAKEELADEDLVENKPVLVSITQRGYIKRTLQEKYRAQSRGSVGAKGAELREEDAVQFLFLVHSLDTLLFFSDKGKVYSERAYQIPEADRAERGIALAQIITVAPGENITAAVAVPDFNAADYCTMVTRKGKIKRVVLSEFAQVRPSGLIATNLEEGDVLGWVKLTLGGQDIIIVTEKGQAARYSEDEVRAMGRAATGVNAIRLDDDDFVTSMEVVDPEADLLVVTEKGYGKRTPLSEYAAKSRAIGGVATIAQKSLEITGRVASARVVREEDEVTIMTTNGQTLRLKVAAIRQSSRSTMGTRLINLKEGDTVASVARLAATDLAAAAPEASQARRPRLRRRARRKP